MRSQRIHRIRRLPTPRVWGIDKSKFDLNLLDLIA